MSIEDLAALPPFKCPHCRQDVSTHAIPCGPLCFARNIAYDGTWNDKWADNQQARSAPTSIYRRMLD